MLMAQSQELKKNYEESIDKKSTDTLFVYTTYTILQLIMILHLYILMQLLQFMILS